MTDEQSKTIKYSCAENNNRIFNYIKIILIHYDKIFM